MTEHIIWELPEGMQFEWFDPNDFMSRELYMVFRIIKCGDFDLVPKEFYDTLLKCIDFKKLEEELELLCRSKRRSIDED